MQKPPRYLMLLLGGSLYFACNGTNPRGKCLPKKNSTEEGKQEDQSKPTANSKPISEQAQAARVSQKQRSKKAKKQKTARENAYLVRPDLVTRYRAALDNYRKAIPVARLAAYAQEKNARASKPDNEEYRHAISLAGIEKKANERFVETRRDVINTVADWKNAELFYEWNNQEAKSTALRKACMKEGIQAVERTLETAKQDLLKDKGKASSSTN